MAVNDVTVVVVMVEHENPDKYIDATVEVVMIEYSLPPTPILSGDNGPQIQVMT